MRIEECKRCIHSDLCKDTDYLHFIGHCLFFSEINKWIPCAERMPDKFGYYLVTDKSRNVYASEYGYVLGFTEMCFYYEEEDCNLVVREDIIAWMPLPKPYEIGGDEK